MALFLALSATQAQENVRSIIERGGGDWIEGDWTGSNGRGEPVQVAYRWGLDGHLLEVDLVIGGIAYHGMILRNPTSGELIELGADDTGGMTRSTWTVQDGRLISDRTGTRRSGDVARVRVEMTSEDPNTARATVWPPSTGEEAASDPIETVVLKKVHGAPADD